MLTVTKNRCYECGLEYQVHFFDEVICSCASEEAAKSIKSLLETTGRYNMPVEIKFANMVWDFVHYKNSGLLFQTAESNAQLQLGIAQFNKWISSGKIEEVI